MNNYEINLTQSYPDRNGRMYDPIMMDRAVYKFVQSIIKDELKKMNIEIEEYDE